MKKEGIPLYPNWLKPTKLKILFTIILFLIYFFMVVGTCMLFISFNKCLTYFVKKYFLVILFSILASYVLSAWSLRRGASLFVHKKMKKARRK